MIKRTICRTCGTVYIMGLGGNKWGCNGCVKPEHIPSAAPKKEKVVAVTKANSYGK